MGALMAVVGVVLIIYPFATAGLTNFLLGAVLLIAGVADFIFALFSQTPGSFFGRVALAILYGVTGLALILFPFQGIESLTLLLGAMLVVRGVVASVAAFRVRPVAGWGWMLADGVMSTAAGVLVLAKWPASSVWAVGTLVGASVLVTGISRLALAARIRSGADRLTPKAA